MRIIVRRVHLRTHSLETELHAMHSRKAQIKHCFATSELAVSKRASVCKPARSRSNTLTKSCVQAYLLLSLTVLPNQWTFIALVSPYARRPHSGSTTRSSRGITLRRIGTRCSYIWPHRPFLHRAMLPLNRCPEHYMFLLSEVSDRDVSPRLRLQGICNLSGFRGLLRSRCSAAGMFSSGSSNSTSSITRNARDGFVVGCHANCKGAHRAIHQRKSCYRRSS